MLFPGSLEPFVNIRIANLPVMSRKWVDLFSSERVLPDLTLPPL